VTTTTTFAVYVFPFLSLRVTITSYVQGFSKVCFGLFSVLVLPSQKSQEISQSVQSRMILSKSTVKGHFQKSGFAIISIPTCEVGGSLGSLYEIV
jgi:hypothetical protein